jgi:hypothetical protein
MYESAQRALINNTAMHSQDAASSVRKRCTGECQYRRKRLRCSRFRYFSIQRLLFDRRHHDSAMPDESALRGL